jgi:collagen triple helix repeat protein
LKKGRLIPLLAGVIALLVIAGIASASQASHHRQAALAGPFCISKRTGVVRQVGRKVACHANEIRKVGFAVNGLRGPAGPAGSQGPAGAPGPQGLQGVAGATGAPGAPGLQGLPGPQGAVGPQGPAGAQGSQGPQGLAGVPGISSITAVAPDATCSSGGWLMEDWQGGLYEICNGTDGADGQTGLTGPQGAPGDQGLPGPQGAQGDPGADGTDGAPGVSAIQEVVCDNGASGVDVTTPAGIIRLCDGQDGATGPQGPKGDTGPQGPQGNTGLQGPKGDTGATGPQGPAGPTGPQGPAGTASIYNAGGTPQTGAHIAEGAVATNVAGNGSVTFAGSAAFTSPASYVCTLTAENTGAAATNGTFIATKASSGFTFKSTLDSTTFDYICVGN